VRLFFSDIAAPWIPSIGGHRMSCSLRAATLAALLSALAPTARATDLRSILTDYTITGWSQKDGLAPGWVYDIVQSRDGYLWLGTSAGLYRFDGAQMTPWDSFGSIALPRSSVSALSIDEAGDLWVAFAGDHPLVIRIHDGVIARFSKDQGYDGSRVTFFLADSRRTLWMGTEHGVLRFANGQWQKWTASGLPADVPVYCALEDATQGLVFGTSRGIFRRAFGADRFVPLEEFPKPAQRLWDDVPRSISQDLQGRIWVTDRIQGYRIVGDPHDGAADRGRGALIWRDHAGNMWVGTLGQGLWRFKSDTGRASVERLNAFTGLLGDGIRGMFEDRDGNIWIGTTEGLNRLTPRKVEQVTGLGLVEAVDALRDGTIYVGTVDGLLEYPRGNTASGSQAPLRGRRVSALHIDARDNVWVATDGGVARLSRGARDVQWLPATDRLRHVQAIASTGPDDLWIYDAVEGLMRWRNGRLSVPPPSITRGGPIVYLFIDRSESLWLAFAKGGITVVRRDGELRSYGEADGLPSGKTNAIYQDDAGVVWTAGDAGIGRLRSGRFETVRAGAVFPAVAATGIIVDGAKTLWAGTSAGIVRFTISEFDRAVLDPSVKLRYRLLNRGDGLAGLPYAYHMNRRTARASDGRLWFVTGRGLTIIRPEDLPETEHSGLVRIESVVVNDRRFSSADLTRLPADTSRLVINYTALNVTWPMRTRFRYRLEGFDSGWSEATPLRQAFYTNLPPRAYRFRVAATSDDAAWPEVEATWAFAIAPHIYQTAWFRIATPLAIALVVLLGWRMHARRMRRQFTAVVAERARLSREIHDTLLQGLVGVSLQLDAMSTRDDLSPSSMRDSLVRMRRHLEAYIREARQSIWHLRSSRLETLDLASALRASAISLINGQRIALEFGVTGDPHRLSPAIEMGLLRIGEEAISNAVRHGNPSRLGVCIGYADRAIQLEVADDGQGFDPSAPRDGERHFGVTTMKERAAEIGGSFAISSGDGRTCVRVSVPVPVVDNGEVLHDRQDIGTLR
jgi:signal transduction histidine kinase/ligand-binding sensor domain-containing protein